MDPDIAGVLIDGIWHYEVIEQPSTTAGRALLAALGTTHRPPDEAPGYMQRAMREQYDIDAKAIRAVERNARTDLLEELRRALDGVTRVGDPYNVTVPAGFDTGEVYAILDALAGDAAILADADRAMADKDWRKEGSPL